MLQRNECTATPKQQSELVYSAQQLENALSRLETRISDLQSRLGPVIEERPTTSCGIQETKEREMFSTMGRGIMDAADRIETVNRWIDGLLDTLAL